VEPQRFPMDRCCYLEGDKKRRVGCDRKAYAACHGFDAKMREQRR
jgi:hypothetical protein